MQRKATQREEEHDTAVLKQKKTKQSNAQQDKTNKSTAKHINI